MSKNFAVVIEDDMDLSEIFSEALRASDYEVEAIRDGRTAQERLKEIVPTIIMLDLHLPYVDGSTLLKQIKEDARLDKTRVILATADGVQAERYRKLANLVMVKPITYTQLRDLSKRLRVE
jgi:DNA-binding response OmpR family regulator